MARAKRIPPDICEVIDPDGAVLLDLGRGKYYSLNGVGAVVWQQLCAAKVPAEIAMHLADVYGIPLPAAQQDVTDFLAGLERAGLLNADA